MGVSKIVVTGIKFDQTEAAPTPSWNAGNGTRDTKAPSHTEGQVTAYIHWTPGGVPQDGHPLPYPTAPSLPCPRQAQSPCNASPEEQPSSR
ncbi:hypothetical protein [Bifidobacterium xylocopae]|uniref:hypothetical protein n=1 Tax=Bifidobacterium xylocopae TaxID=2493119 RepID=UPI000FDE9261|nr:hypothetical protein [Bifidobacterium xylocopae]